MQRSIIFCTHIMLYVCICSSSIMSHLLSICLQMIEHTAVAFDKAMHEAKIQGKI